MLTTPLEREWNEEGHMVGDGEEWQLLSSEKGRTDLEQVVVADSERKGKGDGQMMADKREFMMGLKQDEIL